MKTLSFVLWMLLWWPLITFSNYLYWGMGYVFSDGVKEASALINFIIWIIIGMILYKKI